MKYLFFSGEVLQAESSLTVNKLKQVPVEIIILIFIY